MAGMKIEALLAGRQAEQRAAIEAELRDVDARLDRLRTEERLLEARVRVLEQGGGPTPLNADS
jgi:uncharacterized protein (DUF58 family)